MKISKIFSRHRKQSLQSQHGDFASLEAVNTCDKVCLKVTIPDMAAEQLNVFLREKGLQQSNGIPLLVQYGLSDENEEELEKLRSEMGSQVGRSLDKEYTVMKFQAYEYFMENKALTMRLNLLLSENRQLKQRLEADSLRDCICKDEWDNWDEARIDEFFDKYVLMNRH